VVQHGVKKARVSSAQISGPSFGHLGTANLGLWSLDTKNSTLQDRQAAPSESLSIETCARVKEIKMGKRENTLRANAIAHHSIRKNIAIEGAPVERHKIINIVEKGAEFGQLRCLIMLLTKKELMYVDDTVNVDSKGTNQESERRPGGSSPTTTLPNLCTLLSTSSSGQTCRLKIKEEGPLRPKIGKVRVATHEHGGFAVHP